MQYFSILFVDEVHGEIEEEFETFDAATEYWQEYADTPTCVAGWLTDLTTGEVIWHFDDREAF